MTRQVKNITRQQRKDLLAGTGLQFDPLQVRDVTEEEATALCRFKDVWQDVTDSPEAAAGVEAPVTRLSERSTEEILAMTAQSLQEVVGELTSDQLIEASQAEEAEDKPRRSVVRVLANELTSRE